MTIWASSANFSSLSDLSKTISFPAVAPSKVTSSLNVANPTNVEIPVTFRLPIPALPRTSKSTPTANLDPSNVKFALPSNESLSLNWIWVLEPPGDPLPPPPRAPHDGLDPL